MSNFDNILKRDGQTQRSRFPAGLDPDSVKIDGRSFDDLTKFIFDYADITIYYDVENQEAGSWKSFFEKLDGLDLEKVEGDLEPHLSLLASFLKLLKYPVDEINSLTEKHLNFYYGEILKLKKLGPIPDKSHLIFELKKNIDSRLLNSGTRFSAGKDITGKILEYELTEDIVVNRSKVENLRSVYVDNSGAESVIRFAPVANSSDGMGGKLDDVNPGWKPFGNKLLPQASLGFALASPILKLSSAKRTITADLTVSNWKSGTDFDKTLDVYLTGSEGWLGPFPVNPKLSKSTGGSYKFNFEVSLSPDDGAIVEYDTKLHKGNFDTSSPIMQVLLDTKSSSNGYSELRNVILQTAKISVTAENVTELEIKNDFGNVDPSKPFSPFGAIPKSGSKFHIGCSEALSKNLSRFNLRIKWLDVPASNLGNHYNYGAIRSNDYFQAKLFAKDDFGWETNDTVSLFATNAKSVHEIEIQQNKRFAGSASIAKGTKNIFLKQNRWAYSKKNRLRYGNTIDQSVLANLEKLGIFKNQASFQKGFITLELVRDFLHKEFTAEYTKAVVEHTSGALSLPKEPYTPVIDKLEFDYSASTDVEKIDSLLEDDYLNSEIEFYHITPFGQMQQHSYLVDHSGFVDDKNIYLLQQYPADGGEFYIGVEDIEPDQNLSLLFQVLQGSANPEKQKANIAWSILSDNYWLQLDDSNILSDATNGLLTSGIIKFSIPSIATNNNSLFSESYYWLKAKVEKDSDSVCDLLDVRSNAALVEFRDNDNDPNHLENPLPAKSISKFIVSDAAIKSIDQPYSSFGGKMQESDENYYTRVSERLRHKNRAVTIWDYERIVLQKFPSIYKVKSLNHSSTESFSAPGHVTIIPIPDLKNLSYENKYQPKTDLATLTKIKEVLQKKVSPFVQLHVVNPEYEEIKCEFKVRFKKSYEFGYYKDVLNKDIIDFISPWTGETSKEINFGGRIHKSVILYFIEKLMYVDFITDFRLSQLIGSAHATDIETAEATNPKAILVSVKQHDIKNLD